MKWTAINGSWRHTTKRVEEDVRREVREIFQKGNGMTSGGALGVDYFATDEALKLDPSAERIRIFLPTSLETYIRHYFKRAEEGIITREQATMLASQLEKLVEINKNSVIENSEYKIVNKKTYYERIDRMMKELADELTAFHVNRSAGVQYTIERARKRGIPVKIFTYKIRN